MQLTLLIHRVGGGVGSLSKLLTELIDYSDPSNSSKSLSSVSETMGNRHSKSKLTTSFNNFTDEADSLDSFNFKGTKEKSVPDLAHRDSELFDYAVCWNDYHAREGNVVKARISPQVYAETLRKSIKWAMKNELLKKIITGKRSATTLALIEKAKSEYIIPTLTDPNVHNKAVEELHERVLPILIPSFISGITHNVHIQEYCKKCVPYIQELAMKNIHYYLSPPASALAAAATAAAMPANSVSDSDSRDTGSIATAITSTSPTPISTSTSAAAASTPTEVGCSDADHAFIKGLITFNAAWWMKQPWATELYISPLLVHTAQQDWAYKQLSLICANNLYPWQVDVTAETLVWYALIGIKANNARDGARLAVIEALKSSQKEAEKKVVIEQKRKSSTFFWWWY